MSKATRQSCVLLSITGGCTLELYRKTQEDGNTLNSDLKNQCVETYKAAVYVWDKWPDSGISLKDSQWCEEKISDWRRSLRPFDDFFPVVLAAVIEQCMLDLQSVVKNRYKQELLDSLTPLVQGIQKTLGISRQNILAYDEVSRLMGKLYELIEWKC